LPLSAPWVVTLSPDYDLRNYDRMLGAQDVIRHLRMLWENQNPQYGLGFQPARR
jgi:hypothetical protein